MKQVHARQKVSIARKAMFAEHPEMRDHLSNFVRTAWADGKFENVSVGRCKWIDFEKSSGQVIKVQGTWELAYAKWMDLNCTEFITHRGRIPYVDSNGTSRSYYPDFYLPATDEYIDIKCKYFAELQVDKFECVFRSNPHLKIRIILKDELLQLGVIL